MKIRRSHYALLAILPAFGLACTSRSTGEAQVPAPLFAGIQPVSDAQAAINQNLSNNHLPTPSEVVSSDLADADDSCEKFRSTIPSDWFQDSVSVPEDPEQPSGRKINVFYYGKIFPGSVPTLYFNGGPAEDSHSDFTVLERRKRLVDPSNQISLIFLDQRGTGCSDPYPQGYDSATIKRLRTYGSRGIVADAEAVRRKVWGDRPWIAAGQSYGGFVVHRYATVSPNALKAAFSNQDALSSDGYSRILNRVASQARVLELYLSQYPDDRLKLERLKNFLTDATCFSNQTQSESACGYQVLSPLSDSLLGFSDQWLTIHLWLGIMTPDSEVSRSGIERFLDAFYFEPSNPLNAKNWADAVIGWVDRNVPPEDAFHCKKIQTDLMAKGIDLSQVLVNECMAVLQKAPSSPRDTSLWIQSEAQDLLTIHDLSAALVANSTLQFFLYSGERDTFVPVANFTEELGAIRTLPNVHYVDFNGTGHDASFNEPTMWDDWMNQSVL